MYVDAQDQEVDFLEPGTMRIIPWTAHDANGDTMERVVWRLHRLRHVYLNLILRSTFCGNTGVETPIYSNY